MPIIGSKKGMSFALLAIIVIAVFIGALALLLVADALGFIKLSAFNMGTLLTIELP